MQGGLLQRIAPHAHFDQANDELGCPVHKAPPFVKTAFDLIGNGYWASPGDAQNL